MYLYFDHLYKILISNHNYRINYLQILFYIHHKLVEVLNLLERIKTKKIKHIVSFHKSIKRSKDFKEINSELTTHFSIYYTIIIIVFIGSINWNLDKKLDKIIVIYGLLPSLYSIFIIILNLINYDFKIIIVLLVIFLILQLLFDYKFIYSKKQNKIAYYFLRLPLTFFISVFLLIFIS